MAETPITDVLMRRLTGSALKGPSEMKATERRDGRELAY